MLILWNQRRMSGKHLNISIVASLLLLLSSTVSSDCGCNKIQREPLEIHRRDVESQVNEEDTTPKVCPMGSSRLKDLMHDDLVDADSIANMALIPSGMYSIGTDTPVFQEDREAPERQTQLDEFYLDSYEVSNRDFVAFVDATKYVTEAEHFGDSFVFEGQISHDTRTEYKDFRVANAEWWYKVKGVDWRHPTSPDSSIATIMDHPVVHVSWKDASEYCAWREKRLPTEDEWEAACRGGKKGKLFPWGNKLMPKNQHW